VASPWLNPGIDQERAWHEQRRAALTAHRNALDEVMALRGSEARRRYIEDYRNKWGALSAAWLEARVMAAWEQRFTR
jgi:hypothetical protein